MRSLTQTVRMANATSALTDFNEPCPLSGR